MKKNFFLGLLVSSALLLSSCLAETESQGSVECLCTVSTTSNQVVFYADGGGTIYPTAESIYSIGGLNGLNGIKRAHIVATYPASGYSENENHEIVVRDATLQGMQKIFINEFRSKHEAELQNLTAADSLSEFVSLERFYAYNGYITAIYKSKYYVRNSVAIQPTMNMILERKNEDDIKNYDATLLLNLHPLNDQSKEMLQNQAAVIKSSIDVAPLSYILPATGIDSISITLNGLGLKSKDIKIAVKDLARKF